MTHVTFETAPPHDVWRGAEDVALPAFQRAANAAGKAVWSAVGGFDSPPAAGSRLFANGGFGPSEVVGYFVEHGYLGLRLRPDKRPDWHRRQNPGRDVVCLFGAEVEPLFDLKAELGGDARTFRAYAKKTWGWTPADVRRLEREKPGTLREKVAYWRGTFAPKARP